MNDSNAIKEVRELLSKQKLGVLASVNNGMPHTSIVGFACSDDLHHIYFGTPIATIKYANLRNNPRVEILVDNRQNLAQDFSLAAAVSGYGKASTTKDRHREKAQQILQKKTSGT
jgi:general stress protein 26